MKKNILPIIGIALGMGLILWSIMTSGSLAGFIDIPSIVITVAGSFCALLISFPIKTLKNVPALLKKLLVSPQNERGELIDSIVELAKKIGTQGALSIEDDLKALDNEMLVYGLQMVVDGVDGDAIEEILETEAEQIEVRHSSGQEVFLKWGEYAPAFGMIGTLIGLIVMLGELNDPSTIGSGMATALLTTFYGSMLSNLVFLPIAKNLEIQTQEEANTGYLIIEGVLSVQKGQNPRVIEQKLKSFLSVSEQQNSSLSDGTEPRSAAARTEG